MPARGLEVAEGDLLSYLQALPDGALGGLIAIQVVEHLDPDYLMRALDVAYHKLRPGARIVLETINPACWFAFFASYVRDLTHVRPLHPETLTICSRQAVSRVSAPSTARRTPTRTSCRRWRRRWIRSRPT